jgi:hypothetical protein
VYAILSPNFSIQGIFGEVGIPGRDGYNGLDGRKGEQGESDGYFPTKESLRGSPGLPGPK